MFTGITATEKVINVQKGDKLTLECTVIGKEGVSIIWKKDGETFTGSAEESYDKASNSVKEKYEVKSADNVNSGTYTCESSESSAVRDTISVDVYGEIISYYILHNIT